MVTVLGHRGYLGAVVARRWAELGETGDYVICTFDDLDLIRRLARAPGVIVPSTDAIAEDTPYAERKRAIEAIPGIVVIRSGIVDTRKAHPFAYTDWWCNPVTPLEWADAAWALRDTHGVHEVGRSEAHTRFQVVWNTAEVFHLNRPWPEAGGARDRTVRGSIPTPLIAALTEYRDWLG